MRLLTAMKFAIASILQFCIVSVRSNDGILRFPLIPHHHVLQRDSRRLLTNPGTTINNIPIIRRVESQDEEHEIEVGGLYQGYGTHYVDLWIGTPPQRQTVIVDTGSGITAFPCQGCKDCGKSYHASDFFTEANSQTFSKLKCSSCVQGNCRSRDSAGEFCSLSVSYQEGSMWAAYEAIDVTYLGGLHDESLVVNEEGEHLGGKLHGEDPLHAPEFSFNMAFGCQNKVTGLFKTQLADGIMGMCLKPSSIFEQMHKQNIIEHRSFSLCFVRGEDAAKDGTVAGALTIGGTDSKLHEGGMIYAKGLKTKGVMHGVNIRKIYLMKSGEYGVQDATPKNTVTVQASEDVLNSGSVIVDSGTTDTYLTRLISGGFHSAFKEVTGFSYNDNGMKLSEDDVFKLPTIIIQLVGADGGGEVLPGHAEKIDPEHPHDVLIAIPPAHYIEYDSEAKKYVGRFSTSESRGSVLGANTMRGHDIYFDISENGRIGIARSNCDYNALIGLDIQIEDKASGQQPRENDDYYESGNLSKLANPDTEDSSSMLTKLFDQIGITGVAVIVCAVIIAVVVTKRVSDRRRAQYQAANLEKEHLNELHLDTEVQMAEIS